MKGERGSGKGDLAEAIMLDNKEKNYIRGDEGEDLSSTDAKLLGDDLATCSAFFS